MSVKVEKVKKSENEEFLSQCTGLADISKVNKVMISKEDGLSVNFPGLHRLKPTNPV